MMYLFSRKPVLTLMALTGCLIVSACGDSSGTVDNSEITEMNAAGMMEGTINDASAMDVATDTNVATGNVMDNAAADADNATGNVSADNATE